MKTTTTKQYRGAVLKNLKALRESREVTRQQLADGTGLNYSYIWRLEERLSGAGYGTLTTLANFFETRREVLTGEESIPALGLH
jgi:transcriptional regulator with XRE-family HTH domain